MAGINGVSVGRDVSVTLVTPRGQLSIDITTSFDAKARYDRRRSRPLNGPPLAVPIPDGWEGTFELDRTNSQIDSFFAAEDLAYFAGRGISPSTISETIVNVDNSVSVFIYTGVMLMFEDAGRKQADELIKMRVSFEASERKQLG